MKSRGTTWDWINYLPHSLEVFKGNQPIFIEALFSVIFFKILSPNVSFSFQFKKQLTFLVKLFFFNIESYNILKFHSCQIFFNKIDSVRLIISSHRPITKFNVFLGNFLRSKTKIIGQLLNCTLLPKDIINTVFVITLLYKSIRSYLFHSIYNRFSIFYCPGVTTEIAS